MGAQQSSRRITVTNDEKGIHLSDAVFQRLKDEVSAGSKTRQQQPEKEKQVQVCKYFNPYFRNVFGNEFL